MGNKFEIKKSIIDGKGAFAIKSIRRGELICRMDGEKIFIPELKRRYKTGRERLSDPLQVGEKSYIDLYEPYVFINHSCGPNAAVVKFNELVAIKDIDVGKEGSWQDYDEWFIECKCQSPSCRKKIGEFYLLPKDIQKENIEHGNVRDFIAKKYIRGVMGNKL